MAPPTIGGPEAKLAGDPDIEKMDIEEFETKENVEQHRDDD